MNTGPNFPAIIHRNPDDIAEARAARMAGISVYARLPDRTRAELDAWLDRQTV